MFSVGTMQLMFGFLVIGSCIASGNFKAGQRVLFQNTNSDKYHDKVGTLVDHLWSHKGWWRMEIDGKVVGPFKEEFLVNLSASQLTLKCKIVGNGSDKKRTFIFKGKRDGKLQVTKVNNTNVLDGKYKTFDVNHITFWNTTAHRSFSPSMESVRNSVDIAKQVIKSVNYVELSGKDAKNNNYKYLIHCTTPDILCMNENAEMLSRVKSRSFIYGLFLLNARKIDANTFLDKLRESRKPNGGFHGEVFLENICFEKEIREYYQIKRQPTNYGDVARTTQKQVEEQKAAAPRDTLLEDMRAPAFFPGRNSRKGGRRGRIVRGKGTFPGRSNRKKRKGRKY